MEMIEEKPPMPKKGDVIEIGAAVLIVHKVKGQVLLVKYHDVMGVFDLQKVMNKIRIIGNVGVNTKDWKNAVKIDPAIMLLPEQN